MSVQTAPCEWPVSYADCDPADEEGALPAPLDEMPDAQVADVEEMAATYLWNWTGRRLGLCPVIVRPCRQDCWQGLSTWTGGDPKLTSGGGYSAPFGPALIGGEWFNLGCGRCGDNCSCSNTPTLRLPGPIDSITEVRIDGEALPADGSAYKVFNHRLLTRVDGGEWPTCQDLEADPDDPENAAGSFQVSYVRGIPVPVGGQYAAGTLAVELAKALCNDSSCQLPRRVQTVSRQGVTVAMLDSFDDIDTGHTGIWSIDSWIASITKTPTGGGRVYSPDIPRSRPRRQTWPALTASTS